MLKKTLITHNALCINQFMGTERLYTQGEVSKIFAHIPGNTLLYWARQDLVPCHDEKKDGRGVHRLYSIDNLYVLGVVEKLLAWRIKPHIVQSLVDNIMDSNLTLEAGVDYIIVLELEATKEFEAIFLSKEDGFDELTDQNFITSAIVNVTGVKKLIDDRIKVSDV
ncbi:MAG: hypothetical protein KJ822_17560 [Proteobacteria bacterium]|nr:hypothetical protein [Pseudomonadota bacterium]